MSTVVQAPVQGAAEPALHPAYVAWIHEAALLIIKHGDQFANISWPDEDKRRMTDEADALRAQGVGPKRASVLLDRLAGGRSLTVIAGGGKTTKRRARLALVQPL